MLRQRFTLGLGIAFMVCLAGVAVAGGQPSAGAHTATRIAGGPPPGPTFTVTTDQNNMIWGGILYTWDPDPPPATTGVYVGTDGSVADFNTSANGYQYTAPPGGNDSAGSYT